MHPRRHAETHPDKPAIVMAGSGEVVTYGDLEAAANRAAQLFRACGVKAGEKVAFALHNSARALEFAWGAQRAGLYFVAVSSRLTADEIAYILEDSGARLLLTSDTIGEALDRLPALSPNVLLFKLGGARAGYRIWEAELAEMAPTPIADESAGVDMLYSSGTTGRPKGIVRTLTPGAPIDEPDARAASSSKLFGTNAETVYLCPAPLYHSAPLRFTMTVQRLGGTNVIMEKFEAEACLAAIEKHQVTLAQFVPTHFSRLLALPEAVRAKYDHRSLQTVVHAAAPCPVPVKRQMIEWWGPILSEYYAGSEGVGTTFLTAPEWLAHPGSVGRGVGGTIVHICDDDGAELPPRREGHVFFEGGASFQYHNDPAKTAESRNRHGWATLGDIGWLDEEGYLYLTDRKSFMIISGGVNIYPQEIENHLVTHPKVADVAVIGAPHPDLGEKVVAVVEPRDWTDAGDDLAKELLDYCRGTLSGVKIPKQIDFLRELPREPTGKLFKRKLRDAYWAAAKEAAFETSQASA